jgi:hypothetical protein
VSDEEPKDVLDSLVERALMHVAAGRQPPFVGGFRLGIAVAIHLAHAQAARERTMPKDLDVRRSNEERARALEELVEHLRRWHLKPWGGQE